MSKEVVYRYDYRMFNPNGWQLMRFMRESIVRFIILYGGSSSAKSYSVAQVILMMTLFDGENTLVFRKVGASIEKSIYEDFRVSCKQLHMEDYFKFTRNSIRCTYNGAKIDFSGLDDPEKIKGISNYKRVHLEEFSEFEESDFKQIRKRLRGKEGQQISATFNPIRETHWIKKSWLDGEKWHDVSMRVVIDGHRIPSRITEVKSLRMNEAKTYLNPRTGEMEDHAPDIVLIQSTYLNNFWVVGSPDGTYGYYDEQCVADFEKDRVTDPDYFRIYALGEWGVIRTGSEFFGSFNIGKQTADVAYNPGYPIHVSVDNNVLPYISVSLWQYITGDTTDVNQFAEICCESPDNTVKRAGKRVAEYLKGIKYADKVYLHGDASTRAANTIDDEKRSWLDLFIFTLEGEGFEVVDCVGDKNPSVAMTGEFINAIFEGNVPGVAITIGKSCTVSIEDYLSVQKDANGAILKTKVKNKTTNQTYEEHGHLCFTADTIVATKRGDVPIVDVKIGDYVLTRKGYSKVYNSFCTSCKSQIIIVSLCVGKLMCTDNHPIYTERGFIPANQLKSTDKITTIKNGKPCKERLSSTTVSDLFAILSQNLKVIGRTIVAGLRETGKPSKSTCTAICGSVQTGLFLKATMFIILMAITITTHLIISPLCLMKIMLNTTMRTFQRIAKPNFAKYSKTTSRRLRSGINLKKAANGILKTLKSRWETGSTGLSSVLCAAESSHRGLFKAQSSAQTAANQSGAETMASMMLNALVGCVVQNLRSISTLKKSVALNGVPLSVGGETAVYDISVDDGEFFANNILVHNCDTFRYVVHDLLRDEFTLFSNRRKRNLYARDGALHFYNPASEETATVSRRVLYMLPNINGKFCLLEGCKVGDSWRVVDVVYHDNTSTDEIAAAVESRQGDMCIVECGEAYYQFVRKLRATAGMPVRMCDEEHDPARRIAATSDFVKSRVLFNETAVNESPDYSEFITHLLDYNADKGRDIEASVLLSGFVSYVVKF